ncbi:MAG: hypothetical protein ACJ8AW_06415 [Rhodopila sp.]
MAAHVSTATHVRVSVHDQRHDLGRQVERLCRFANEHGPPVAREVKEIDPGRNGHRLRLSELLVDFVMTAMVVEHRDRLCGSAPLTAARAKGVAPVAIFHRIARGHDGWRYADEAVP